METRNNDRLMPDGTESDGCTGWPNGDWEDCCIFHDLAYRSGDHGFFHRRKADFNLLVCVARRGYLGMGILMFFGVRAFGWVPWHANYRNWVGKKANEMRKEKKVKELLELYWLALLVFLEARSEPYAGQLAVAWVVMTRAQTEKKSVQDVVLAAYQFSAFNTKDPNRMQVDVAPFSLEWKECLRAACGAYFASEPNPAPRANNYLNPKIIENLPEWYRRDKIVGVFGNHEFLRV